MRVEFLGLKENSIPVDMYILIKEPYFSPYDIINCCYPTIRVSDPKDVIFNADHIFEIEVPFEILLSKNKRV